MIETDPYERWKQLGRPGGSFESLLGRPGLPEPQVAGGSVAPPAPTPGGPGAFNQAWMNEGLAAYNAGQRGSDPLRTPGFDPNTFRQTYGAAQGGNRPEDLARFSNETLAGWMPFYDPGQGKYRSMRGAEGWFDKPTECPPGTGPSGPNETDPCTATGYGAQPAPSPLQNVLAPLQGTPAPGPAPAAVTPLGKTLQPFQGRGGSPGDVLPPFPQPTAPVPVRPAVPMPGNRPAPPMALPPFQPQPQTPGLTNMMAGYQRRPGQWF
jgi:hypothetical protein